MRDETKSLVGATAEVQSDIKSRAARTKAPNYGAAIRYVMDIPADPITLTSINPEGGPTRTVTFKKSADAATKATQWVKARQDEGRNIYYQDCSVTSINKRPTKDDVSLLHAAHVDVDVKGAHFTIDDFATAKVEVLAKINACNPPPSIVIDTGNGYQAFWYLADKLPRTFENIAKVEAVSKRLASDLGGDACHDVAHLMRLPHTINFPNAKKRALGRVKCLSRIESDERWINVYSLASLPSDPVEDIAEPENAAVDIPNDVGLSGLDADFRNLIVEGPGARSFGDGTRSAYVYYVSAELIRQGFSDGQIAWITSNPDFAVSAHILDQKQRDPFAQALRAVRDLRGKGEAKTPSAAEDFVEPVDVATVKAVDDAAQKARRVWERDAAIVITPPMFIDLTRHTLMSDKSFAKKYGHYFGKSKSPAGDATKSKMIARYDRAGYRPTPPGRTQESFEKDGETYYNLYRAPDIEPIFDAKPEIYLAHLRYLIADRASRIQFADWLAHIVQHPDQKTMFAPLLIGPPGTGKSWLAEAMKVIVGAWNASQPRNKTLTRDFNGWMAQRRLAIIHELKGKFDTVEVLKDLITQLTIEINLKGIEAFEIENFVNFLTISNHDDAVPLDDDDRRWLGLECAKIPFGALPKPSGNKPYTRTPEMDAYYTALFKAQPPDKPATDETRRFLGWLLKRNIVLDCQQIAPATKAHAKVVDASRSSLETLIVQMRADKVWPFNATVFTIADLFEAIDMSKVEAKHRHLKAVEKAARKIGCQPLMNSEGTDTLRVRTTAGHKRLWVYAIDAASMTKQPPQALVAIYERARSAKRKTDDAEVADDFAN